MIRRTTDIDEQTGEVIKSNDVKLGTRLKGEWIVVYKDALKSLVRNCPNYSTMKVYLEMAAAQDYNSVTMITLPYIGRILNMSYQTVWNAGKWLQANGYIKKATYNGNTGFVLNPKVTTCGKKHLDKKTQYVNGDIDNDELVGLATRKKAEAEAEAKAEAKEIQINVVAEEDIIEEEEDDSIEYGDDIDLEGFEAID